MTPPRFFADNDFDERILAGLLRREPCVDIERAREHGLQGAPDEVVLNFAIANGRVLLSHDKRTMRRTAEASIARGASIPGLFLFPQDSAIGRFVENLLLIWIASDASEWIDQIVFLPYA